MTQEARARATALGQEIHEKAKERAELLRSLPAEPVEPFTFETLDGSVSLEALFGEQPDLIVIHNMGKQCPYCTMWADGLNGLLRHLERRAAVVLCNADTPDVQRDFAASRGWGFRMIHDPDRRFATAMGYAGEHEGKTMLLPGYSTFHRDTDGTITRIAHDAFGPGDLYCGAWHMFGLLASGADGWQPTLT